MEEEVLTNQVIGENVEKKPLTPEVEAEVVEEVEPVEESAEEVEPVEDQTVQE